MRNRRLAGALGVCLAFGLWVLFAQSSNAQVFFPAEEPEPAPAVTPEDVRAALEELLASGDSEPPEPLTTDDPEIEPRALEILLAPLTRAEINIEIDAWFARVQEAVAELSVAEFELFELSAAEEAAAAEAREAAEAESSDETTEDEAEAEVSPEREALIERVTELREVRTAEGDRLKIVLDAFEAKGGTPEATAEYRTYLAEVGGVRVDTQDARTMLLTLTEWAKAEDGGQRLVRNLATVLGAGVGGIVIGWLASITLNFGLKRTALSSKLLRHFVRRWIVFAAGLVGFLVGLSWIGTNMTPILAGLGAAGFILAFALQNTISNFASGLLILFQRPFDAGDEIEAAGISGEVESVSLFSTYLSTDENRKVIVPNNMIWDDVIVNSTGAETRRLSIEVEVDATEHGLEDAEELLMQIMSDHPDVLYDPAPDLKLRGVTTESLTFVCWPWVKTAERDRIRWDLVARFGRGLKVNKTVTKAGGDDGE
ncbi:MAG: mechanosensitive ion channel family protein [Pseudomonadota bacterium]